MSLIFALLTLVALSLAAVALVRSVDTSTTVIGNLGFKQDSTFYAGQAAEEAIAWLNANKTSTVLACRRPGGRLLRDRDREPRSDQPPDRQAAGGGRLEQRQLCDALCQRQLRQLRQVGTDGCYGDRGQHAPAM